MNELIYGKGKTNKIVGLEFVGNCIHRYVADGDKTRLDKIQFNRYCLLADHDPNRATGRLEGTNHYKYYTKFHNKQEMHQYIRECDQRGRDYWRSYNDVESYMITKGDTLYKDMKLKDVSVLSFDIETTGVKIDDNSYVLLISNTYRDRDGNVTRKLFSFDDYETPKLFLEAWCKWVRSIDPDIMLGHNVYGFDFPYLVQFAKNYKAKLKLGRDGSNTTISRGTRKFRKDGSQFYEFNNVSVFGRNIIDTFFMSFRYGIGKYPSNGLKQIIEFEGLQKEGRQFWDFSKNKEPWNNVAQFKLFKQYAEEDADDALALYDLMAPQFFYYAQSIPKTFQEIGVSGTGSQVNSFMMRAYLQRGQAVPKASEKEDFVGAISIGNPGLYNNVYKVDVASLYPSIMLTYNITDPNKDPDNVFLSAVKWFTEQRLNDKKMAQETGDRYYTDMSNGRKIMINSFYGFMGAPGLNFNYPKGAAETTRHGREILQGALDWAEDNKHVLVNADTDSISFEPGHSLTMTECLEQINKLSPDSILWTDDGIYDGVIVVKAKNYLLQKGDKLVYKGSALKATMKEKVLAKFLKDVLALLLKKDVDSVVKLYTEAAEGIKYLQDISQWCSKKTVTEAVLNPKRTTEQRILDAIGDKPVQEGDKIRVFFKSDSEVALEEHFDGTYDDNRMYEKLFKTVKVLSPVLDISKFPNYKLKKNKKLLEEL